ncbi:ATP-dependent helicase SGS1-like, partial [Dendronephthya gigantea]|uniref:ATP-dependent helicase SGS1-like n=1 Tax=Dendronephthya gigantea TaxID=151771 RepID=UPI00106922D2
TGGGKSVCYWIAGLATMGITVVITPLIALLNDQVSKLQNCGVKVTYVSSTMYTKDTVELAYIFKSKGIPAVYYHGQLGYFEETDNSRAWLSGKVPIICATSAFGMGIDKSDVRFVVHLTMPKSLEEYFQEAGRAGRDSKHAQCSLMFRFEDRNKLLQLITTSASDEYREHQENALNAMVSYCMSSSCRRKLILQYFDDDSEVVCNSCDNCRKPTSAFVEYTQQAINVCQCLEEMIVINPKINVKQLALTFKGSKSKRDVESKGFHNIAHYGVGQSAFKNDADAIRFVQHLIIHGVLMENIRVADGRFTTPFITLGKNVKLLRDKKLPIILAL